MILQIWGAESKVRTGSAAFCSVMTTATPGATARSDTSHRPASATIRKPQPVSTSRHFSEPRAGRSSQSSAAGKARPHRFEFQGHLVLPFRVARQRGIMVETGVDRPARDRCADVWPHAADGSLLMSRGFRGRARSACPIDHELFGLSSHGASMQVKPGGPYTCCKRIRKTGSSTTTTTQ